MNQKPQLTTRVGATELAHRDFFTGRRGTWETSCPGLTRGHVTRGDLRFLNADT